MKNVWRYHALAVVTALFWVVTVRMSMYFWEIRVSFFNSDGDIYKVVFLTVLFVLSGACCMISSFYVLAFILISMLKRYLVRIFEFEVSILFWNQIMMFWFAKILTLKIEVF